jgi:uncharacterized membrane protein
MAHVLVVGESWVSTTLHTKGFDSFETTIYQEGVEDFRAALVASGHTVEHLPCHTAADAFPSSLSELGAYDVVVLSDIGSNTLLLPARTFVGATASPNRLALLRDWVAGGGALAMIGGYLSFSGIEAKANYRATPLAEVLPVELELGDDRQESPEGVGITLSGDGHPVTSGIDRVWPPVLGFQRLTAKPGAQVLAHAGDWPALVTGVYGQGRVLAFASDIGPHWAPRGFTEWSGYSRLWGQAISWLAAEEAGALAA